jgi:energy-coupling factor transporter ATP-binding protein EcfA2
MANSRYGGAALSERSQASLAVVEPTLDRACRRGARRCHLGCAAVNSPLLFLSHAGVDTDAAGALKARLLAAPDTLAAGLRVWFDKDDLRAGEPWVHQLEEAIRHRSTAFAVYVGSRGVVNWVNAEVQLALGRAVTDASFRFIPFLAPQALQAEALPGFVALYQGVANVEGSPEAFAKLVAAVLGGDPAGMARLEPEPFFGLKAVDEARAHLFFGREVESEALVQLLANEALVMVTGDSGSGKSSLARAGLLPRWRGGVLAELTGVRAGEVVWHVVQTQPRSRPFAALAEAVGEAAKQLGLSLADRGTLESWVRGADVEQVRRALWCDLPPDRTRVLLLVDQFEELVTIADPAQREPFVRLLLALADPRDPRARVVLTMRRDYYNLLSQFPALFERLETNDRRARYLVGRMKDEGLRRVVTEPCALPACRRVSVKRSPAVSCAMPATGRETWPWCRWRSRRPGTTGTAWATICFVPMRMRVAWKVPSPRLRRMSTSMSCPTLNASSPKRSSCAWFGSEIRAARRGA